MLLHDNSDLKQSSLVSPEREKAERWAIIGGGMLGLSLALRLAQPGRQVIIFESAAEIGGLAATWNLGDVVWDKHYHVTLMSDTQTRALLAEIGIESELEWTQTRTGFYTDGKLYSMSDTAEFLKFPPLRLIDKLRLGGNIFLASRIKNWRRLERIRVADWLTRYSGRRTFEKIWLPLLRAKLGESYKEVSAAFIWATIARMYAARRTGLKKEMFGYVRGGYARVLARLVGELEKRGVEIRLQQKVAGITRDEQGSFSVETSDGEQNIFDNVIVTAPSNVAARLCPQLTAEEKAQLNGVRYQGIVCASLLLKNPLADYYVTNITADGAPFTAVIEMTALVKPETFGGRALVYLPKYVAPDDALFDKSDAEIRESFVAVLEKMYPHFRREDVLEFKVSRVRQVFPLPVLNYSEKLPAMQTSLDGLFIINSAHIVNGTLNVNETVQLANTFTNYELRITN